MNSNITRIKKYIRRIEATALAILIAATSVSFTATATENGSEQKIVLEQKDESEQEVSGSEENIEKEDIELKESGKEEIPEQEKDAEKENPSEQEKEIEEETSGQFDQGDETKDLDDFDQEEESEKQDVEVPEEEEELLEEETLEEAILEEAPVPEDSYIEYSMQTDAAGYKIKLEAYDGVFPEGEDLSLSATQIEDQDILDVIDSKLNDVCEGEFKQISFDIKVLNAAGEELQPDRSKYIENEDIIPIQLSIELANDEIEGEVEVFHFADDLSSMECLESTVDGDEVTVEPEHFSVFTILETTYGSLYSDLTPPTGYRTYIEWMPNSTAGLRRLQKIYVYAQAGEQIYFGSSSFLNLSKAEVEKSLGDSFGYTVGTAPSEASIAVTLPWNSTAQAEEKSPNYYHIYGSSANPSDVIDQIENHSAVNNIYLFKKTNITDVNTSDNISVPGTIYNWQQEALGPNTTKPGGYAPLSFKAPYTGVYTFRFFGTKYTAVDTAIKAKKTDAFPQLSRNYVGAWDITVTENDSSTTPIKGRTFTDALFWTIGANVSANEMILNEHVYALTSDGFEYKVDFNGLDPFGFVFYTNKRGFLVSSDDHEDGKYRSLARSVKSKRNQLDDLLEMGVHLNSIPTTDKDESYLITFEEADPALLTHYTGRPQLANNASIGTNKARYTNFNFTGLNSGTLNEGTEGYGGYFAFYYDQDADKAEHAGQILPSTYEIILDFTGNTDLEAEYGYPAGIHNEVILSNTLVKGDNKIFWNGKDEYGNVVIGGDGPGLEYKIVSFYVKAGEVHFPLLDVENNRYGIKIEMQNGEITGVDKSKIYYDNSDSDEYGKNIGDRKEKLVGVSATPGAMAFSGNAGDYCAIDIWTDYRVASPLENKYAFKLLKHDNTKAFFRAQTKWEYFYKTTDGKRHFDSSIPLPKTAEVVLQYRTVDRNTVGIGGVDTESPDWETENDTGPGKDWQIYSGPVTVTLQTGDSSEYTQSINLVSSSTSSFDKTSGSGDYKSVTIESYRLENNSDPYTSSTYKEASEGLCVFTDLPLHPNNSGTPDLSMFYQYRVVDIRNTSLASYVADEVFDRAEAVEIPEGAGHVTKRVYLEETLEYRFIGATEYNLEFDQLWNDSAMPYQWITKHRPKAVRVAVLYGIPLYEDEDTSTEYDKTIEKGYYGEDVEIVWRRIQKIKYLTLHEDGVSCTDSDEVNRKLSLVSGSDGSYAAYFPVGKYMANGDPYFYKIRPISYSMDGIHFTDIEYLDTITQLVPKRSLPEFYGVDEDADDPINKKYRVVFYDENVNEAAEKPDLYPKAVKFTDIPEIAEIELTKTDDANNPILGKAASYEILNKFGKNLVFTLDSEGKYIYEGLAGTAGLPSDVTSVLKTSTLDSIVHASGLPLNEYRIREVNAPEGYQLNSGAIEVVLSDYLSDSTSLDHAKFYLCKKLQKDSLLPNTEPTPNPSQDSTKGNSSTAESNRGIDGKVKPNITNQKGENHGIMAEKLPKTGGLVGSLVAMILGAFMVGLGIYLMKPSKKQRNNKV